MSAPRGEPRCSPVYTDASRAAEAEVASLTESRDGLARENEKLRAVVDFIDNGLRFRRAGQLLGDLTLIHNEKPLLPEYPAGWSAWLPPEGSDYIIAGATLERAVSKAIELLASAPTTEETNGRLRTLTETPT